MKPLNRLRLAAGLTIDPKIEITEHLKVPRHRGELAPKTEKNMRKRASNIKKVIEIIGEIRDLLVEIPGVDYNEDIPDLVKHLHQMLHGDDGTSGLHGLHNAFSRDLETTAFADEMEGLDHPSFEDEELKKKAENEAKAKSEGKEKKKVDEASKPKWLEKAEVKAEEKEGKRVSKTEKKKVSSETEENEEVTEKKPKWLEKAEVKAEEKDGKKVSKAEKKKVDESHDSHHAHLCDMMDEWCSNNQSHQRKDEHLFNFNQGKEAYANAGNDDQKRIAAINHMENAFMTARADTHVSESMLNNVDTFPVSHTKSSLPVNVVGSSQDNVVNYNPGAQNEFPNQLMTNPYNDSQKISVPDKIREQLEEQIKIARKDAMNFTLRKDWDNKNFYENMANALEVILEKLDKKTVYGMKEAQIFMTSLMSPITNKIPSDVIKFIAYGGTQRSLKSYMKDVSGNFPVMGTSKPYKQDNEVK